MMRGRKEVALKFGIDLPKRADLYLLLA